MDGGTVPLTKICAKTAINCSQRFWGNSINASNHMLVSTGSFKMDQGCAFTVQFTKTLLTSYSCLRCQSLEQSNVFWVIENVWFKCRTLAVWRTDTSIGMCKCFCCVWMCMTWEDGVEVHWWLVGVHSDLKLGCFGWRGRNTHQCQRKTEPGLKNPGNSWEKQNIAKYSKIEKSFFMLRSPTI